jgi:hypothetical protein
MNKLVEAIKQNSVLTYTENGDVTYSSSLNALVDLFFHGPAYRGRSEDEMIKLFEKAYNQDKYLALRTLLWLRDVRGGAGERKFFRVICEELSNTDKEAASIVMSKVADIGRYDDLLSFRGMIDAALDKFADALCEPETSTLAAKWAPKESSKPNKEIARYFAEKLGLTPKQYRKMISSLNNVIETKMCDKDWEKIEYGKIPSKAASKYTKAFSKNDSKRYNDYIAKLEAGDEKINAGAIFPYDVIKTSNDKIANEMWKALPNWVGEDTSFIPMIDVSASMDWCTVSPGTDAMQVAISLGIYLAQRNNTEFKNCYLTFSSTPELNILSDNKNIKELYKKVKGDNWGGSTNLDAAFDQILNFAVRGNVPAEDMPKNLLVLSDMEFNSGQGYGNRFGSTAYERAKMKFANAGYKLPNIVWWNIASRNNSTPVLSKENGTALVGGCSPAIVKNICNGRFSPEDILMKTIMNKKYDL